VLHRFPGANGDGATPQAPLAVDVAGNLYGTTYYGGENKDCQGFNHVYVGCGIAFELSPPMSSGGGWTESVIYTFTGPDGAYPNGGLVFDSAGNLYGVTAGGGSTGYGVVYELSPPGSSGEWTETVLYSFGFGLGNPSGTLVFDQAGNLYGESSAYLYCGIVFQLAPSQGGTWTENVLYSFQGKTDGCEPSGGLIFDHAGNLYGVTTPDLGSGNVFKLSPSSGGSWTETTLHTFQGLGDGSYPVGPLTISKGALYGTTTQGGNSGCSGNGCGVVYQLLPGGQYQIIHHFLANTTDGSRPEAGMIADPSGNLYGTASQGGGSPYCGYTGCGAVYELSPPSQSGGDWTETTLYGFSNFNGDGSYPQAVLLLVKGGVLVGTTADGGDGNCTRGQSSGCGTVFAVVPIAR